MIIIPAYEDPSTVFSWQSNASYVVICQAVFYKIFARLNPETPESRSLDELFHCAPYPAG